MSRPLAGFWIAFFFVALSFEDKWRQAFSLCTAFAACAAIIAVYDFARFGTPLESGYNYEIYLGSVPYRDLDVPGNIPGPLFSLSYLPPNFRTVMFGQPNPQGVSVSPFLISPFLVYLFGGKPWQRTDWLIAVNALAIISALLCFRSIGFSQATFRYSLDFMPFVFLAAPAKAGSRRDLTR